MTKSHKIIDRMKYWKKKLNLKRKFRYVEDNSVGASAYVEVYKKHVLFGFNCKVITLKKISNHVDRVVLHEIGHIIRGGSEYKAEKYMLNMLYKYNKKLYNQITEYMKSFLYDNYLFAWEYPLHYKEFCKVYNVTNKYIL